jgi:glutaminyl-tRNA synthetase
MKENEEPKPSISFIEQFIAEDIKDGKNRGKIVTRFPPRFNC